LFGSLAKDDIGIASDIDLLMVQETKKRFIERLIELYDIINPKYALDLLVYTQSEFDEIEREKQFCKADTQGGKTPL